MDFRRPLKSSNIIDAIHQKVRATVSHVTADRIFSKDIEKAIAMIESKELLDIEGIQTFDNSHDLYPVFGVY